MTGTPILVGAGQFCERVDDPGYEALAPAAIAAKAGARALADAGGRLNATIDVVASTRTFADMGAAPAPFGTSTNFPRSIAARLGLDPEHAYWDKGGGNSPQRLVNLMCERLAMSQARAVLIAGGEATATVRHLQRTGAQPSWAETVSGSVCDQGWGLRGLLTQELVAHGLSNVPAAYALLENARRHHLGTGRDDYARAMARMFAPFTEVAATNPYSAAATVAMSAAELLSEEPSNRVIASPYPLSLVARDQGNQGAALVLTTAEHAHRVGVPEENWIYLHGHADLTERQILDRPQLGAYPAAVAASRTALDDAGVDVANIAFFDFYSCFPIAVSAVAVDGLGLAPDDPRGLTVTGGMPYFGGPGNDYSLHAIAEMACRLRAQPGSFGFIGANGGFLSKYSTGVYSTSPAVWNAVDHRAVQHDLDRTAGVERELRPDGPGFVETFTVIHTRGKPSTGVVIGRLIDSNARFIATTIDGDGETLDELLSEHPEAPLGRRVHVTATGSANRFTFSSARMQALAPPRQPGLRKAYEFCRADIRGHVLEVTIDRPDVRNALHPPASEELADVFDAFDADPELWVAIITGAGTTSFCAGNDLKWTASGKPVHFPLTGFAGLTTRPGREKPLIAAVNGYAMGGGFEICLASDLVIADDAAHFALSEVRIGLIAGAGGLVRLPRQVPAKVATEYILTGQPMSADIALHWGLVNRVVATGTALAAARELADRIVEASPTSVRLSMRAIGQAANHGDPIDAIRAQTAILDELFASEDAREGPLAFAEKRQATWHNR